jgi:hypothetical protein
MSRVRYPASPLARWLNLQNTHHVTAKQCWDVTSLHMLKLHEHKEKDAAVLLAVCVLRDLPSNGFTPQIVIDFKGQNVLCKDTRVIVFWGVTLGNLVVSFSV